MPFAVVYNNTTKSLKKPYEKKNPILVQNRY